jgi:hypothetical protein
VCRKPDNCTVSRFVSNDGKRAVYCGRTPGTLGTNNGGQHLHWIHATDRADGLALQCEPPQSNRKKKQTRGAWDGSATLYWDFEGGHRAELAGKLGVSIQSLERLGAGWHPQLRCWTFPERDATGKVIGISTRLPSGQKKMMAGGARGLTYAADWDTGNGPICLVEGGSDTAAGITIGISVIGRPSNRGGVAHLKDLLAGVSAHREIIVIAERDQKENGDWPGKDGAISVAEQLADALGRQVIWALPPDNAKDTRAWLLTQRDVPRERLISQFLAGLERTIVPPPAKAPASPQPTSDVSSGPTDSFKAGTVSEATPQDARLNKWHGSMLRARIASLNKPGVYLDTSPAGAGKSYVDCLAVFDLQARDPEKRALLVYPTHKNCDEIEDNFLEELMNRGIFALDSVAVLPPRLTKPTKYRSQNCWNSDADDAERMGLPVISAICTTCPLEDHCTEHGYLRDYQTAMKARIVLCTHKRAEYAGFDVIANAGYISVHESPIDVLRPPVGVTGSDLIKIQEILIQTLEDPKSLNSIQDEQHKAVHGLLDLVEDLLAQLGRAESTVEWRPVVAVPFPRGMERILYRATRAARATLRAGAWRIIVAAASGKLHSAAICVDLPAQNGTASSNTIPVKEVIGCRYNPPPESATVWFNDATFCRDQLELILNKKVSDKTPPGQLEIQKKAIQFPQDITQRTSADNVRTYIRGVLADRPKFTRVGVICHKRHIGAVRSLGANFDQRVVKVDYFRSGEDRSSNKWHEECDLIIVVGTPRVPRSAVAQYLVQVGEVGIACEQPEWGLLPWTGTTESGRTVTIRGFGFRNDLWQEAHRAIVRAQLRQAVGRGRGILKTGCEVVVLSNEECGLVISDAGLLSMNGTTTKVLQAMQELSAQNANKDYLGNRALKSSDIAERCGLGRRQTQIALRALEDRGFARRDGRRSGWLLVSQAAS